MTRARWISVLVAAGLLGSCGEGLEPPTTGSIALVIRIEQPQAGRVAADSAQVGADSAAAIVGVALDVAAFTSARATAEGPTNRTVNLQLVDNFWEGSLDGLNPGTYTVTVEGLTDGAVAARGTTPGVSVQAGQSTNASVTLGSFVPTLAVGIGSPTTSLVIPVTVSTVNAADGYRVEWAPNANFSGAAGKTVPAGASTVNLTALGTYYIRARALSGTTPGAPSAAASVDVVGDVPATGNDAASALPLGFGSSANQRLTQLNIVPATDEDWFAVDACRSDTLVLETFAGRLAPTSDLNTYLRVFGAGGLLLDENDDIDATNTDSRIQVVAPDDGSYGVQVTSAPPGSVGRYELGIEVRRGPNNDGSSCAAISVAVSPATATIAPGATQQFTATATDAGGQPVTGLKFFWVSSNSNVAVVDTTGLATGVGGGSVTITAAGLGEPGNAVLTVTGPALGTPTQLAFSAQPTTSTAGQAFSPAIEVEIRDVNGQLLTGARNAVTLAIANNPGGATLYGTKTVSANGGVARFAGLYMDKSAANYTLSATASGLTAATSNNFTVTPGAPTKLAFGTQPANVEGNVAFGAPVTATIVDAYGNVVTGATNAVTMDIGVNVWKSVFSSGSALFGTKTANAVSGVATFNNLRVDKPGPGYTLTAAASGLAGAASTPFAVNLTVQQVRPGKGSHTCAATSGGSYCWGYGGSGQLGDSTTSRDSVAQLVRGGLTFTQVTAGSDHSCGLTAAGAAYCWGYNGYGQLGNNSTTPSNVPVAVQGSLTFSAIAAGATHTCGIAGAAMYCWGNDNEGELGDSLPLTNSMTPVLVKGGLNWAAVSGGFYHTCGLTTGGDAYCWGYNYYGQIGNGSTGTNLNKPAIVSGGKTWGSISAGYYHSCGVDAVGAGFCWGVNYNGVLGADTVTYPVSSTQPTPVPVFGGLTLATVGAGSDHTCGITTAGDAYCWGYGGDGRLGTGATTDSHVRALVSGGHTFTALSVGGSHSCGLVGTTAWCWGYGYDGQLGNGATGIKTEPVQIVQ